MPNDPSDSKLPAHESFWTIAFRVQYLAFCREADKDNPDIYAETLARLHNVDGKQREPDGGSKLSLLLLPEAGRAQGGAVPLPSAGKEQLQTLAPTAIQNEVRSKKEPTKGGKLDLKSAAEYYKDGAADDLHVEARKDRGAAQHVEKNEGKDVAQLIPLPVNGTKEVVIKSGNSNLKSSAGYNLNLETGQKPSQVVQDSQGLHSPSTRLNDVQWKNEREQWSHYCHGYVRLSFLEAGDLIYRHNLKTRRKLKATNLENFQLKDDSFSEVQRFFKCESVALPTSNLHCLC
jgi:hypothetical protein